MVNRIKTSQKEAVRKTPVSKLRKEKQVNVIKHFQPNVARNIRHRNSELPEVDNDVDVQEYLRKLTSNKRFLPKAAKEIYSENEIVTKSTVVTRNRNKFGILNKAQSSFKSKSCVECSTNNSQVKKQDVGVSDKSKAFVTKKTKSFSVCIKKPDLKSNSRKSVLVSSSSSDFNETHVNHLRNEINKNRCTSADRNLDTKLYLMQQNEIHNEKVRHLRDEIQKLIHTDLDTKKKHVTELKTEIAQFRKNDCVAVYNMETEINVDDDNDGAEESFKTTETIEGPVTAVREYTSTDETESTVNEAEDVAEATDEKAVARVGKAEDADLEQAEEKLCRSLCVLDDEQKFGTGQPSLHKDATWVAYQQEC